MDQPTARPQTASAAPNHPRVTREEMEKRVARFEDIKQRPIPVMFIDSVLPGHYRMNYAVVGDTASENPDFDPALPQPHRFQIGMFMCPPGNGPAYHTHDYIELFMPLTGRFRFFWGNDMNAAPEGYIDIGPWDVISLPPGVWRKFENTSNEDAWCFAVLEAHQVFAGKDPYWAPEVERQAAEHGFKADERGKMIMPDNYQEVKRQIQDALEHRAPFPSR
ncbi:MAG: cupin domain-containing protein [Anaerolineae bacterium]